MTAGCGSPRRCPAANAPDRRLVHARCQGRPRPAIPLKGKSRVAVVFGNRADRNPTPMATRLPRPAPAQGLAMARAPNRQEPRSTSCSAATNGGDASPTVPISSTTGRNWARPSCGATAHWGLDAGDQPGAHGEERARVRLLRVFQTAARRALRRKAWGGCPNARRKARRIRSGSAKPVSAATSSIV